MFQEFGAAQTPAEFRSIYSRFLRQFTPPADVQFQRVDAGGVPAEWVTPPGASAGRTILHLHGGGSVVGAAQDYRELVSRVARAAEA